MPVYTGLQDLPTFLEEVERKIGDMQTFDPELSMTEFSLNAMDLQDQYYNVYLKGAIINLCLDIRLRELSHGQYGVQNLVLELLDKYGVDKPFEDDSLFSEIVTITGYPEFGEFFEKYVSGTEPLPLNELLGKVGFRLENGQIVELSDISLQQRQLRKQWINQ